MALPTRHEVARIFTGALSEQKKAQQSREQAREVKARSAILREDVTRIAKAIRERP